MTQLALDFRRNLAEEIHHMNQDAETARHDKATEAETFRSNLAQEKELNRSHLVNEAEIHRSNVAREFENNRANLAKEKENFRSNKAREKENHRANIEHEAHERALEKNEWVNTQYKVLGSAAAMSAMTDTGYGTGIRKENENNFWKNLELGLLGGGERLLNTAVDVGSKFLGSKGGSSLIADAIRTSSSGSPAWNSGPLY